jgi:hypothetical protein
VARKILESKREEMTGMWRKLHNFEHNHLKPSAAIIIVIKQQREQFNTTSLL